MNRILFKIVMGVTILFSSLSAEITQKQLDDYMEVSIGKGMLKYLVDDAFLKVLSLYDVDAATIPSENLKEIRRELYGDKYVNQYTKGLKKLSPLAYNEIMLFYRTAIGKKYKEAFIHNFDLSRIKSREMIIRNLSESSKYPLSDRKVNLIDKISQALSTTKVHTELSIKFEIYKKNILPKKLGMPKKNIVSLSDIKKKERWPQDKMEEHQRITDMFWFKDFTEKELEQVLEYATTEAAKIEYRAVIIGMISYYAVFIDELMKDKAQEIEAMMKKQKMTK